MTDIVASDLSPAREEDNSILSLEELHGSLAGLLVETSTLEQFRAISRAMTSLLRQQSRYIKQSSIETTLTSIATICSEDGPRISDAQASGYIYMNLYNLLEAIIKHHRQRLEGRLHILVTAVQALLRILLTDPASLESQRLTSCTNPPWLQDRLQTRHAERFTRLLEFICEPSAAAVAHAKKNALDSATDAAKRSAGQHMFRVLQLYVKLQLEVEVPRETRKAL